MQCAVNLISRWVVCFCLMLSAGAVSSQVCGTPGKDGVTFARNTYFPGNGVASAGATTVNFGTARVDANASATAFAVGDMALIIQMQDSSINNSTNTGVYGDGVVGDPGSGSTSLRSSGLYEFKRVLAATATSITLDSGLANTYTNANANTTDGNRRWQVVRVPQFAALTLPGGTVATTAWNGTTGGVFILDVSGTLSFNNTTVTAAGVAFRGGGSQEATVISGVGAIDYASAQAAGAPPANRGGAKGEGIAGTPRFVRGPTITNGYTGVDLTTSGYPNSLDLARGAPGNAGGGGTQHNSGGGGGGNAGTGGKAGSSYGQFSTTDTGGCVNFGPGFFSCGGDGARDVGGFGGLGQTPAIARLYMGGGGGAGDANNNNDFPAIAQSSGGNGGGLIYVRARVITGSGALNAVGQAGESAGRDGGGGGGAGGTIIVITESTSVPGLTANTAGGTGGNTGLPLTAGETQGTGGGGGGGAVILSAGLTIGAQSVAGGSSGQNQPQTGVFSALGATAGAGGVANVPFGGTNFPNPASCFPTLTVTKATTTPTRTLPLQTTAQYVITISNSASGGAAAGVAVTDILPTPFLLTSTLATAATVSAAGPASAAASGTSIVQIATPGGTVANSYVILPGGSVSLTFNVSLDGAVPGTYQNPANVLYSDPTRAVAAATISPGGSYTAGGSVLGSNYASGDTTNEDVTVAGALATVTSAPTACVASTREITATNIISNSNFADTAASPGNAGGVGLAGVNTEPANNNVSYQIGLQGITAGAPNLYQSPFPGDAARTVAGANTWLLANGNTLGTPANGIWWSQDVSGLVVGRTYTFIIYASSPTDGAQNGGAVELPALRLTITQAAAQLVALGSIVNDTAAADVWRIYQTIFLASQSTATLAINNTVATTGGGGGGERRGLFALAQPTLRLCSPLVNLTITKSNGTNVLTAGGTTSYTVTIANLGPSAADGSVFKDAPSAGLTCNAVNCTATAGGASCPTIGGGAGQLSIGNLILPGAGVVLPTLPSGSTVSFSLACGVTATGL